MAEISVHSDRIAEALRLVQHSAASIEARPILNTIVLEGDADGLRAVAADNYRIAIAEISEEANEMGRVILRLDDVPLVLSVLRAVRGMVLLSVADGRLTVAGGSVSVTVRLMDGVFPNYREAINWETEGTRRVLVVNPAFLADLGRALGKRSSVARIWIGAAHDPIIVVSQDYREAIMPQRDGETMAHGIERPTAEAAA
jgi:DNA polymerase III sliding clamp (beta) subunit (PCNA family)